MSDVEIALRDKVLALVVEFIRAGRAIPMGAPGFAGIFREHRYLFEGEDDLLHLAVSRSDGEPLEVDEAQKVVSFLLPEVTPGLIWLKPGRFSHHFYLGHDELLREV